MKLLLVSYHFPPTGGAGVQRAMKFCKYLGDFGVQTTVLAAVEPDYQQDASLLDELPAGLRVLRFVHRPLLQRVVRWRARMVAPASGSASASRPPAPATVSSLGPAAALRASPGRPRWRDAALSAYAALRFPDDKSGWLRQARGPALALLREERFDCILSTAPPVSAHALAAQLARSAGLPWVVDYRDLWTDNPAYAAPDWRCALDRRTEAAWLRQAAGIVTVTPSWQRRLAQRAAPGCPVAFIPNGYDEADFVDFAVLNEPAGIAGSADALRQHDDGAFRLVHTGTFYGPRDPAKLLDGLALYLQGAPASARPLRLRLVGPMGSRFATRLAAFEARHPHVIEQRASVPHREAIAEMLAADALLLVVGAGDGADARTRAVVAGTLPGKVFEYLRSGRPMLLLGEEGGDAAALLRAHGRGWVADETQPAAIADALRQMMLSHAAGVPASVPASASASTSAPASASASAPGPGIAAFERRALAGELAQFLRRCVAGQAQEGGRAPSQGHHG